MEPSQVPHRLGNAAAQLSDLLPAEVTPWQSAYHPTNQCAGDVDVSQQLGQRWHWSLPLLDLTLRLYEQLRLTQYTFSNLWPAAPPHRVQIFNLPG